MFKKFFNIIEDVLWNTVRTESNMTKVYAITIIRGIITLGIAAKFHLSNAINSFEKVIGTLFIGTAWIKK